MAKVVVTQRLHGKGMEVLEKEAEAIVAGTGDPRQLESFLEDADGLIIRIGSIDGDALLAAKNLKVVGRPGVGVALLIPLTFGMAPVLGLDMLIGIFIGGIYGGCISSILVKTPGTPASAAIQDKDYLATLEKLGDMPTWMGPEEFSKYLDQEDKTLLEVIKRLNMYNKNVK